MSDMRTRRRRIAAVMVRWARCEFAMPFSEWARRFLK